jgi:hypothetical protein
MSDQNVKGKSKVELSPLQNKPKYESPILVPLGEIAKGLGLCGSNGSGDADGCTSVGSSAGRAGVSGYCTEGINARGDYCSAGTGFLA